VPDPGTGKPKCYPKGSFIYRLAGRDREKSASYYTPESLTQCLVKYALKELLPGKSASEILGLKVCEPAMGSAAFLNEVVNQLAQAYLERRQQETGRSIPHEQFATDLIHKAAGSPLYAAVVVDEAQDLDAASFSLLRALVGEPRANDLFIVGDPHQRIYGKPVVLSRCGIDIRGRARKLRINYRTTEETRTWATAVLHGLEFDDLDGGNDPSSDYRSLLHGDHPLVQGFEDPGEEQRFLVSTLRQLRDEQQSLASTCVAARTNQAIEKLEALLKSEGFSTRVINADESDDPSDPALRLATMHRVKGLEFDQVFLPGLDASQMPLQVEVNKRPDALSRDLFEQQERSLLHVAATRAKKRVVVSYSGKASPFIGRS
jgi:superfamily I DNA/RNA helicase